MKQHVMMLLFKDIHYDARVQREASALAEKGHRVTLVCLQEFTEPVPRFHSSIHVQRWLLQTKRMKRKVTAGTSSESRPNRWLRFFRLPFLKLLKDTYAMYEFYQKTKLWTKQLPVIDAVHSHDLNTLPAGAALAKHLKARLIYDSHELFNEMAGKNRVEKHVGYWIEKRLMPKVDHLITVNEQVEQDFHKRYGHKNSTVIRNIPELNTESDPKSYDDYWRNKYQLKKKDRILIYQGGMNPERGLLLCIDSMFHLPDHYKLVMLGDGRMKEQLIQYVKEQDIQQRVFFHDAVPSGELMAYTEQAHMGLVMYENTCLNNYLSTPNKIYEYLLAGIPTVSSDHPGKSCVVRKDNVGVCVEERPEAIAAGVLEIDSDYLAYQKRCHKASRLYSWDNEKDKLVHMYEKGFSI